MMLGLASPLLADAVGASSRIWLEAASASVVACLAIGLLAVARYRDGRATEAAHEASAFLLAATTAVVAILTAGPASVSGDLAGASLARLDDLVTAGASLVVAWLLVQGALWSWRRRTLHSRPARALVLLPAIALLAVVGVGLAAGRGATSSPSGLPSIIPVLLEFGTAILFLVAAFLYLRLHRRSGRIIHGTFAAALFVVSLSGLQVALVGGWTLESLALEGALRVTAYVILLIGAVVQLGEDLRAARRSKQELKALHEDHRGQAAPTQGERARVAREIHDGIAQDLAVAKLSFANLRAAQLERGGEILYDRVERALDDALTHTRSALLGLRDDVAAPPIAEVITDRAERFRSHFGVPVTVHASDVALTDQLVIREIEMIASEAFHNTGRHAQASRVAVFLDSTEAAIRLEISDNGLGFEGDEKDGHFGLRGMRERAARIGGRLDIRSIPGFGTRVLLHVPRDTSPRLGAVDPVPRLLARHD